MHKKGVILGVLMTLVVLSLFSCGNSHPRPELLGNWKMVDNWSLIEGDFAPRKEDPKYEEYHAKQQKLLKDVTFYFGKEYMGTIDQNGDTAGVYLYDIQEDSILVRENQTEYIELLTKDSLLIKKGVEYSLFVRKSS